MAQEQENLDTQVAALKGAWQTLNMAEIQALDLGEKILGKETLVSEAGPFFEQSSQAKDKVDALRAKLKAVFDAPVPQRQAFIEEYLKTMPECCDAVCEVTTAFTRALVDFTTRGTKQNNDARKLLVDLENIQSGEGPKIQQAMSNIHARHKRAGLKVVVV